MVGVRVVCSVPLDLRANWVFRAMPFRAGPRCLRARRRALLAYSAYLGHGQLAHSTPRALPATKAGRRAYLNDAVRALTTR